MFERNAYKLEKIRIFVDVLLRWRHATSVKTAKDSQINWID